jgi:tRNA(adenine34) deaminase
VRLCNGYYAYVGDTNSGPVYIVDGMIAGVVNHKVASHSNSQNVIRIVVLLISLTVSTIIVTGFTQSCRPRYRYTISNPSYVYTSPHRLQKQWYDHCGIFSTSSRLYRFNNDRDIARIVFPANTNLTTVHHFFMERALYQAERASTLYSEVPIGAVAVRNLTVDIVEPSQQQQQQQPEQVYEILSEQHNRIETDYDATAHAEIIALRDAAKKMRNWRLTDHTILYCTLEPCIMCYSAIQAFRIEQLVYGAPDIRFGACGSYCNLIDVVPKHPFHTVSNITSGIYANESSVLLKTFFRQRRTEVREEQLLNPVQNSTLSNVSSKQQPYRRWWQLWRFRSIR